MADAPYSDGQPQQPDNAAPTGTVGPPIEQSVEPAHAADSKVAGTTPGQSWKDAAIRAINADWQRSGIAKLKAQEVWPLFLGFMAIAVAAFTLRILAGQLSFMELQLSEMQSGGEDTNALARAAKRQADSTHDLAVAAGKQADRTKDLADRMKEQSDRTKDLVDQARVSAEAARQASITAADQLRDFESSQRAVLEITMSWTDSGGASYAVQNVGATTAVNISIAAGGGGADACGAPEFPLSKTGGRSIHSSPGGEVLAAAHIRPAENFVGVNVAEETEQITRTQKCPHYFVVIAYRDVFGNEQKSFGCLEFGAMNTFHKCTIVDDTQNK